MIIETTLLVIIFLIFVLAFLVFTQAKRSTTNNIFICLCVVSLIWCLFNYMTYKSESVFWANGSYAIGSIVMCTGIFWVHSYKKIGIGRGKLYLFILLTSIAFTLSFKENFLISEYIRTPNLIINMSKFGFGLYIYSVLYFLGAFYIIRLIYININKEDKNTTKSDYIILAGILSCLLIISLSSFVLPFFFDFCFWWY